MEGTFMAVEPNTKLVYTVKAWTEGREETTGLEQVQELTLADEDGKTRLELKVAINKVGPDAGMAVQSMQQGFAQQFDKLEEFLAKP